MSWNSSRRSDLLAVATDSGHSRVALSETESKLPSQGGHQEITAADESNRYGWLEPTDLALELLTIE
jgi:hypothetical protein